MSEDPESSTTDHWTTADGSTTVDSEGPDLPDGVDLERHPDRIEVTVDSFGAPPFSLPIVPIAAAGVAVIIALGWGMSQAGLLGSIHYVVFGGLILSIPVLGPELFGKSTTTFDIPLPVDDGQLELSHDSTLPRGTTPVDIELIEQVYVDERTTDGRRRRRQTYYDVNVEHADAAEASTLLEGLRDEEVADGVERALESALDIEDRVALPEYGPEV